jgi:hypothetical protein
MIDTLDTVVAVAETAVNVVEPVVENGNFWLNNWGEILIGLLAFAKVLVNLTPTEKDNQVFGWFDTLINVIVSDRRKE